MLLNHSGPFVQHARHPGEGLDVVDDRRIAHEAGVDGEGRAVAGLAPLPFQGLDQGRFLAADVGPGAHADGDVEGEALLAGHRGPQQARVAAALQHGFQVRAKIGVFRAEVHDPVRGADDPRADGHAFEHQVGEVGQDHAVFERARLAFIGIADHVLLFARQTWRPIPTSGWWGSRRRLVPAAPSLAPCARRRPGGGPAPPQPAARLDRAEGQLIGRRADRCHGAHIRRSLGEVVAWAPNICRHSARMPWTFSGVTRVKIRSLTSIAGP